MVGLALLVLLALIGLLWVWPTAKAAEIGRRKGRSNSWLWGFALGWIGVIILANEPDRKSFGITPLAGYSLAPMKVCPACAEWVKRESLLCRFCGFKFESSPTGLDSH
jgi:hypothetical protein